MAEDHRDSPVQDKTCTGVFIATAGVPRSPNRRGNNPYFTNVIGFVSSNESVRTV